LRRFVLPEGRRLCLRTEFRSVVDRYYDPDTGQFLTVDPDVDETGQAYAYAGGDPANLNDPSGASIWSSLDSGLNWFNVHINPGYRVLTDFANGDYAGGGLALGETVLAATGLEALGSIGVDAVGSLLARGAASTDLAFPGGLEANDALGGHVLSHVGLSDAELVP
jgi:RHS repeat-associated protein